MSPLLRIVFICLVLITVVLLQIFLAKQPRRWPGLVFPGLFIVASLVALLRILIPYNAPPLQLAISGLLTFLLSNIPTLVLLGLYAYCRRPAAPGQADESDTPEENSEE